MNTELTPEDILPYLKNFISIYDEKGNEVNPIPDGVPVTVYCDSDRDRGFCINDITYNMGLELLIARSWIVHSELEQLIQKATQ